MSILHGQNRSSLLGLLDKYDQEEPPIYKYLQQDDVCENLIKSYGVHPLVFHDQGDDKKYKCDS